MRRVLTPAAAAAAGRARRMVFQLRPGPATLVLSGWMRVPAACALLAPANRASLHAERLGHDAHAPALISGKGVRESGARPASRRACGARCVGPIFRDAHVVEVQPPART